MYWFCESSHMCCPAATNINRFISFSIDLGFWDGVAVDYFKKKPCLQLQIWKWKHVILYKTITRSCCVWVFLYNPSVLAHFRHICCVTDRPPERQWQLGYNYIPCLICWRVFRVRMLSWNINIKTLKVDLRILNPDPFSSGLSGAT